MKASQKNRQARDLNVKNCVERTEIAPLLAAIPEFPGLKINLDSLIVRLDALEKKQFSHARILNTERRKWRQKSILACLQVVPALLALGTKTENTDILLPASVTKTSLGRLPHRDLLATSRALLALCRKYSPDLLVYMISPELLDAMETTCNSFDAALEAAQIGSKEQKQITGEILLTLKQIDFVLGRIALVVETLKGTQPEFCDIFRNAFHVVHPGGSVLSASGYVVEDDSSMAIKKCRLRITAFQPLEVPMTAYDTLKIMMPKTNTIQAELEMPVKLSSCRGGFRYMNLPDGTYELTAFMAGYNEQRVTFFVNRGLHTKLFIRMQKLGTEAA
jgi:hypothetical protein